MLAALPARDPDALAEACAIIDQRHAILRAAERIDAKLTGQVRALYSAAAEVARAGGWHEQASHWRGIAAGR